VIAGAVVQWALAGNPSKTAPPLPSEPVSDSVPRTQLPPQGIPGAAPVVSPSAVGPRRRHANIVLPQGTFVKTFEVEPFVKGRLVWNYHGDQVSGIVEVESTMAGISATVAIDSEIALSSNGVVFGVITGVQITELKINQQLLAAYSKELPITIGPKSYALIEPIINDLLIDTPFSYQCRMHGNRLTISHCHIGLSGPAAKYAMGVAPYQVSMIQAPAVALEGNYTLMPKKEAEQQKPFDVAPAH
jgi:hypothetical protein